MLSRIVELPQPLTFRAGQLGSMALFGGFRWKELEEFAAHLDEVHAPRGTRLTVQGRREPRLWLLTDGEALVSADARPLRVSRPGDAAGLVSLLYGMRSPETTIALSPIRALSAGPAQFRELVSAPRLRLRLTGVAKEQLQGPKLADGYARTR